MSDALSFAGWAAGTRPPTCSQEESEALAASSKLARLKRAYILDRISSETRIAYREVS